ncbi:phosducin-like protein [Bombina bombina]|uniref:phosducin-like protein n=1 Tax=Bombina bombina TaxID=8345 RepID=UPI00235B09B4|nr:phosducin-like protein [Bombina bombina]XP_053552054.1 phosducin-like protein [Bombina bombina]
MTTLDDKLLGEKNQYYYSSSSDDEDSEPGPKTIQGASAELDMAKDGSAVNTGPKGVLNDWRRYKQLETEQNEEQRREMEQLIKNLSMTCKSHLDEERDKQKQKELEETLNGKMTMQEYNMLNNEEDEEFLQQYRKQRIEEMRRQLCHAQIFKKVFDISSAEEFLDTVDKEHKNTVVIILIYEDEVPGSDAANGSILCLALEYPGVKFCRVKCSLLGTSIKFTKNALPALLVYKGGELIGNFVRIIDQLGEDFFAVDLESFLHECSLLPEKDLVRPNMCNPSLQCYSDDSDLEID